MKRSTHPALTREEYRVNALLQYIRPEPRSRGYPLKLSALLAPLIAAKVPHEQIMSVILAFESEEQNALEHRRKVDADRQARKRSRDITLRHSDTSLTRDRVARAEDNLLTSVIEPQDKKVSKQRGTRLPNEFEPDLQFASEVGLAPSQAQTEVAKFRDYWIGKAGAGGVKLDWQATWRNWARSAAERMPRAGPSDKPKNMAEAASNLLKELQNADIRSEPRNPSISATILNLPVTNGGRGPG